MKGEQMIEGSNSSVLVGYQRPGMSALEAGLAMLSAIIGGGIVGIPYAMVHTGIPLGVMLNVFIATAGCYTGNLYLRCKDLIPMHVQSTYELGFVTLGPKSIWIIATLILISGAGCIMIYFIVFGDIAASLAYQGYNFEKENVLTERAIYVVFIALVMTPLCLKKKLREMKLVSILLFAAIGIFILLFLIQMFSLGTIDNADEDFRQYWRVDLDMELVTGFNTIVLAYAYQTNLFPTYRSLGANRNNDTAMRGILFGVTMSFFIYITLGILSIYTFGESLESDVFVNINEEDNAFSLTIRIAFLIVLACHIPYVFFPTKESFLIIIDELQNHSMQRVLERRLARHRDGGAASDTESTSSYGRSSSHQQELSLLDEEEALELRNELPYLKMKSTKYYSLTLALYFVCIIGAIFIQDIAIVFNFVGAFGLSLTSFALPGVIYLKLMSDDENARVEEESKNLRKWNSTGAYLMIVICCLNIILVIAKTVVWSLDG